MSDAAFEQRIAAMRRFSRFYTQRIGALHEALLASPFSLAESRILYELGQRRQPTASELGRELGLDAGYLSRLLRGFEKRGLLERTPSEVDGRRQLLSLTAEGRAAFAALDAGSRKEVGDLLGTLPATAQRRLVEAMQSIERVLGAAPDRTAAFVLRPHRPGDIGWVVRQHGLVYAEDYGWDERFEALVAEIAAKFVQECDPARERCWIAELDGENVGSVFLVKQSERVAKLRLLLVDRQARGRGLGFRLVDECVRFARQAGYGTITLWTNSVLVSARRIYEAAGFRLTEAKPHRSFGHDLVGETWELAL